MEKYPLCKDFNWKEYLRKAEYKRNDFEFGVIGGKHAKTCQFCSSWFKNHILVGDESEAIMVIWWAINNPKYVIGLFKQQQQPAS